MDYTDLYLRRSVAEQPAAPPSSSTAAPLTAIGHSIDTLIGGALSSQETTRRLEALEQRVLGFEERLMNLTRLFKMSQGLQEEKESEYRRENDELRARLERQEQLSAQLTREVAGIAERIPTTVRASVQGIEDAMLQRIKVLEGHVEERLHICSNSASTALSDTRTVEARLCKLEEDFRKGQGETTAEVDATRSWAKRNMQKLKQHLDALSGGVSSVRDDHDNLSVRIDKIDCKAQTEYKKLRLLLQQKVAEADSLTALVDKELNHVKMVAEQHEILRSPDLSTLHAMKFSTKQ